MTDRGGRTRRDAGLAENDRFLSATRVDPHFRGLVGAHASFTLSEASLGALGDLARYHHSGIHIHAAEARDDVERTARAHHRGIVDRLERNGLLNDRAVLAHGVHLSGRELARVSSSGAWLVHNPRSNMNNAVGHAPIERFGHRAALGTDGWPADMLAEFRFAHFREREHLGLRRSFPSAALLEGGQQLASELFGMPFGTLSPGSAADLVVCDYVAPTPLTAGALAGHLLSGLQPAMIRHVMCCRPVDLPGRRAGEHRRRKRVRPGAATGGGALETHAWLNSCRCRSASCCDGPTTSSSAGGRSSTCRSGSSTVGCGGPGGSADAGPALDLSVPYAGARADNPVGPGGRPAHAARAEHRARAGWPARVSSS